MLKGKVAIVTGGTRGIGFEIVRKYLANGAKVVLFGSRQESVDRALQKLKEENSGWEVAGDHPASQMPQKLSGRFWRSKSGSAGSIFWSTMPASPRTRRSTITPRKSSTR